MDKVKKHKKTTMTSDRIISNENDMSKETVAGDESGII